MKRRNNKLYSRRQFIGQMSCAAVGSTALYSTLLNLTMTNRASAQTLPGGSDYKALVCLFLGGGNDSFNMLIPRENSEYASYQSARGNLALGPESILDISDPLSGRAFGLHNSLPGLRDLYNSGDLAFLSNVGTLVEPTTVDDYQNDRVQLPLGLFSHSDQAMHWQSSTPDQRSAIGWAGRAADILSAVNESDQISMNISLSGSNIFQSGSSVIPYTVNNDGAITLSDYDNEHTPFFPQAVDSLLDLEYQNLLKQAYADMTKSSIETGGFFNESLEASSALTTEFPDTYLGGNFRMIANTIAARGLLGMRRQTFFINNGGWDHHDEVINAQAGMLSVVDEAVSAFWNAMGELGLQDDVVLFTASDFARTLSSNGQGSDHGWGGNHFMLGGGLQGGRIYGSYPEDISLGGPLDINRGRQVPTTSVDEYFGELALWMGVDQSELSNVLPNLDRFYSIGSNETPLGFFAS